MALRNVFGTIGRAIAHEETKRERLQVVVLDEMLEVLLRLKLRESVTVVRLHRFGVEEILGKDRIRSTFAVDLARAREVEPSPVLATELDQV